jgi:hypothetical protein
MEITQEIINKIDEVLARGLCAGMGERDGQMCVEAAICYALGEPHGDEPSCVEVQVRNFKIKLNDAPWYSPESRARGMRDLAIAQLGSGGVVDGTEFCKRLTEKTIKQLIPALFREIFPNDKERLAAALECEQKGTINSAAAAAATANAVANAAAANAAAATANAVAVAANVAYADAAHAAAHAANVAYADAAHAATHAAAYATTAAVTADAAYVAAYTAAVANAAAAAANAAYADAAHAAAYAAAAAAAANAAVANAATANAAYAAAATAAYAAAATAGDKYLLLSAKLALEVLTELNSPGVAWL